MVGLTLLLESQKKTINKSTPKVINKTSFILSSATHNKKLSHPSSSCNFFSSPLPPMTFLDACFLCKKKLLPGKDIYMYRGDRAFCSVDCRCRQICMDEESVRREYCSMAAKKPAASSSCSSSSSCRQSKSNKSRAGGFAY